MKHLYTYDRDTDSYKRIRHATAKRVTVWILLLCVGGAIGAGAVWMAYSHYTSPEQKELIERNEQLRAKLKEIDSRVKVAGEVMCDISERDLQYYKILMQCDSAPMMYAMPDMLGSMSKANDEATMIANIEGNISMLESRLYSQSKTLDRVKTLAAAQKMDLSTMPAIMPVSESSIRHISSGFGLRIDPVYEVTAMHEGMDFAIHEGDPVYATADGVVEHAGWKNGYGDCIYIKHNDTYSTRYGHLSGVLVKNGEHVRRGQLIGKGGNTGKSTGPHLHYEVRIHDEAVDPVDYYFMDITPKEYDEILRRAASAKTSMD